MTDPLTTYKVLATTFTYPHQELYVALKEVPEFQKVLDGTSLEALQREYVRLLTPTVAGGLPPYETEYGKSEIFFKTQVLADIAGFYRAFGLDITDSSHERVDFIGAELEFMYWLSLKEERAKEKNDPNNATLCREGSQKFLKDHLGRWAGYFGDQIATSARRPFYALLGRWLSRFAKEEIQRLGVEPESVAGWCPEPEPEGEFECGPEESDQVPQPLTIQK